MTTPGWFPDPSDPSRQRYFDGRAWTENYAPYGPPPQAAGRPSIAGWFSERKIGLAVGTAIFAFIVLASINTNHTSTTTSDTGAMPRTVEVTPTTTKSGFAPAQDQAIAKAKSYLDYAAFSKKGLIKQLEYEKFSTADATFAVEQLEATGAVNWNEQAVKKAKSYLQFSAYSQPALVDQLVYEGFTSSQAQYGASTAYGG